VLALPYVGQRNDHQDALGAGLGVTEFAQKGEEVALGLEKACRGVVRS
jgi:chromosome partitioning protein